MGVKEKGTRTGEGEEVMKDMDGRETSPLRGEGVKRKNSWYAYAHSTIYGCVDEGHSVVQRGPK